jgi:hypothetical protein
MERHSYQPCRREIADQQKSLRQIRFPIQIFEVKFI